MTVPLALGVLALSGLLGCASWVRQARSSAALVAGRDAAAVAGWAALSALSAVVGLAVGDALHPVVVGLLALAALCAVVGVAGAARAATLRVGAAHAAAEAALVGSSLVSVFWVVAGAPSDPGGTALVALTTTTVDVMAAALVVRLPLAPGAVPVDRRDRRRVLTGVAALCLLGLADAATTLQLLGVGAPGAIGPALRATACLLVTALPWVPAGEPGPAHRPRPVARALPYVLVAGAVTVQLGAAFLRPVGPVAVVLVAMVVGGLAAVQTLARRENARLLRDLETSRSRLSALVENAGDVILAVDPTGRVLSANGAAARLLHRTPEGMAGLDVAELAVVADRARVREVVDPVVRGWRPSGRVELRLAAPATGTAELRLQSVAGGAVANLSDVTDSVQLRDRLERLARFDEMTGLPNRSHLLGEIEGWLRWGRPVAVLYTDLDGFKAVNDRFGHQCGDDVLVEAARRLQLAVMGLPAERVLVGRMGGDEFVVALLGSRLDHLAIATERMLAAMRPTFSVADRRVRVGLSIGVATTDDDVPATADVAGAADLLHRADVAMFAAKQAGRFRVMHWDAAMEARAQRRVDIAIGLRRALDGRRLVLAYQPLVRLADGVVIGAEALIRVSGEDRGPGALAGLPELVTPAELVAVAEDTGEIVELGHWVLTEATAQASRWRADGHDIFVTVNVSVRQLAGDGFVDSVRAALEAVRLPAGSLVVEITEGQLLSEQDPAWQAVEHLRRLGVVLVIDDFGSGYSSLSYLRRMPVRGVKLDRALLDDITTDPRARTLARAVIAAARALGLLVVAEGLESLEAARVVRDLGAYAGQGFALSQAVSADEVSLVLAGPPVNLGGPPTVAPPARRSESLTDPAGLGLVRTTAVRTAAEPGPAQQGPPTPRVIDLRETDTYRSAGADLT